MSTTTFLHFGPDGTASINETNQAEISLRDGNGNDVHIFFGSERQLIDLANKILATLKPERDDEWAEKINDDPKGEREEV